MTRIIKLRKVTLNSFEPMNREALTVSDWLNKKYLSQLDIRYMKDLGLRVEIFGSQLKKK